jgi:hypothetical protein
MRRIEFKDLIREAYYEVLAEQAELPTSVDKFVNKFPDLKEAIELLHTKDYKEFVKQIDRVAPRPTIFRIILTNDQEYTLRWMGQAFEATIAGRKYYLGTTSDIQQALDKLAELYQESPLDKMGDEQTPSDEFDAEPSSELPDEGEEEAVDFEAEG